MNQKIIYCSGGIVWRVNQAGREVLLILSRRDQAWKFPKGHIDDTDPSWEHAAQREVKEETGYDTFITDFAGYTKYTAKGLPKVVLYWHMQPTGESDFQPCEEIEKYEWLPVREAIDRLTFLNDKHFLMKFTNNDENRDE